LYMTYDCDQTQGKEGGLNEPVSCQGVGEKRKGGELGFTYAGSAEKKETRLNERKQKRKKEEILNFGEKG